MAESDERITGIVPAAEPSFLRKQRDGRARVRRERARRGAAALNSKFGTNNADPCFVSPWEINALASADLIAPYTPNSNNIYLRRGAMRHGTARYGTARHGTARPPRGLLGAVNAIGFDVCASDRSATRKKRRFSPVNRIARCVAPHTTSFSFIYCL